jgi:hypothetical protein
MVRVEFDSVTPFRGIQASNVSVLTAGSGSACGYSFKKESGISSTPLGIPKVRDWSLAFVHGLDHSQRRGMTFNSSPNDL